ncbi:MAG: trypsin-like peptidase domain-containing protein [Acidilobaceae archaeon]|nr:trypsin-like peptidase domain-containing protein [Acidilobaceae archaeon]MCX8165440.1 trypsin-like peptidase domain-containing protein [Acidilobaceae archaeon]MDW7973867.1 trypsin-like peptidase domain-containing protein [Sulfolobales archaeon]
MDLAELSSSLAGIVREVAKGVVTIYTVAPTLDIFFGGGAIAGSGSGFVIGEGLVVTNYHVVRNAGRVELVYSDGVRESAEILAYDPSRDIALLSSRRIMSPLRLGDSDKLSPGELVLAIGSPLGLVGPSISLGVVSAVGRSIIDEPSGVFLEDLIQTDAAINPGNSGGPIVNMKGEVVGVTTAIIARAQNIGFAIPVNSVRRFILMLQRFGRPVRAWIGVYVAALTPELSSSLGVPVKEGVVIARVVPGTPAYRRGLREGDVIVRARGRQVKRVRDLREAVEDSAGEGCVKLEILRGQRKMEDCVPVLLEEIS